MFLFGRHGSRKRRYAPEGTTAKRDYVQRASSTGFSGVSSAWLCIFQTNRPLANLRLHRLDDTAAENPEITIVDMIG